MIPRTYPSTFAPNNQAQMVIYVLPSVVGMTQWVDYIPVKWNSSSLGLENSYNNEGFVNVDQLSSVVSSQAFVNYIPVFVDATATKPWSTDIGGYIPIGVSISYPLSLFSAGEQGAWYDPSDMSTMFQDSAGTTPVTAVEQPVGLIYDKSPRGNDAFQTTATKRPILSARVNLLTKTEDFSGWDLSDATVSSNVTTSPNGTMTGDKLVDTVAESTLPTANMAVAITAQPYTLTVYAKAAEYGYLVVRVDALNYNRYVTFNLLTGAAEVGLGLATTADAIGDGWYRCSVTYTSTISGVATYFFSSSIIGNQNPHTGDGTSGIYLWGASLVPADQASLPYQRVNTATDYDSVGFNKYLAFDGVDDALVTNSIDFTATDKMTVWAGVRKLSDADVGILVELSSNAVSNAFLIAAPRTSNSADFGNRSAGTIYTDATTNLVYPNNISYVTTSVMGISTQTNIVQVNSIQAASNTASQGAGNYGNYPLFIGQRNQAALPFNGNIHSLIVRGAQSSDAQIASTEQYVNGKTGAF